MTAYCCTWSTDEFCGIYCQLRILSRNSSVTVGSHLVIVCFSYSAQTFHHASVVKPSIQMYKHTMLCVSALVRCSPRSLIAISEYEDWKKNRRLYDPAFVKRYSSVCVFVRACVRVSALAGGLPVESLASNPSSNPTRAQKESIKVSPAHSSVNSVRCYHGIWLRWVGTIDFDG